MTKLAAWCVIAMLAPTGCGSGDQCSALTPCGAGSYQFCKNGSSCRYQLSDDTHFDCTGCGDCQGAATAAASWCSGVMQPDMGGGDAGNGGYYLPAGTTLTPFLSTDPVRSFTAADQVLTGGVDYFAVLDTDAGRIVMDLREADTPITVNSFVFLTLHHYFDGIAFHRVIDGFVAQTGDPNTLNPNMATWGSGGPGYGFGLEIVPALTYDGAGVVGMARTSNPNSNGSQFFITLAAAPTLNGQYTIFARVSEGLDVLPLIVRGEPPATPTRITRAYITQK